MALKKPPPMTGGYNPSILLSGGQLAQPFKPPPAQTPLPFDPLYQGTVNSNNNQFNQANAGLDQQRTQTFRDFGLDDASDPFSKAKLLENLFHQRQAGTTNSYAARGQLYSGAIQNAQNTNSNNYQQGYDALRKGQNAALAAIEARRTAAGNARDAGNLTALGASTERATAAEPDPNSLLPGGAKTQLSGPVNFGASTLPKPPRTRAPRRPGVRASGPGPGFR